MDRIPIYTDVENLIEIFSIDRQSEIFYGMKQFISNESSLTFCVEETALLSHPLYEHLAKEFASGNFLIKSIDASEGFLNPPFKTNLQEKLLNKRSVFFSNDNNRIDTCVANNGILMGGVGQEVDVYNKLNLHKKVFKGNRILTIGDDFVNYDCLDPYILPFTEIIINEPYLFVPERRDYKMKEYLELNFKTLFKTLFRKAKNKVNIIITTFINEEKQHESEWFDAESKTFNPLYLFLKEFLKAELGGPRYKLWLIVSPMARKARHDRFILTNYQFIESGAGLTYFDDKGTFINRGEALHLYSIMHDDMRQKLLPAIISRLQNEVIDKIKDSHPSRIFGMENGNSHFLNF